MAVQVKICGIKTPEALSASVEAGARFIGFVFYPPSPRHVEIDIAFELVQMLPTGVRAVGLFVILQMNSFQPLQDAYSLI